MTAKLYSMQEAANLLSVGRNTLFAKLRDVGIFKKNAPRFPHDKHIRDGLFKIVERTNTNGGADRAYHVTEVTDKGLQYLQNNIAPLIASDENIKRIKETGALDTNALLDIGNRMAIVLQQHVEHTAQQCRPAHKSRALLNEWEALLHCNAKSNAKS